MGDTDAAKVARPCYAGATMASKTKSTRKPKTGSARMTKHPRKRKSLVSTVTPAEARERHAAGGDPRRVRVLAEHVAAVCEVFGVDPDDLVGRVAAEGPRALACASLRKLALGAVARLGRDLDLPWSGLAMVEEAGLDAAGRTTLASFAAQFGAWTGIDVDGLGAQGEPAGGLAHYARDRYRQVLRSALDAAGRVAA